MTTALPLSGKIAVVTGASRGIGAAIALDLAQRGASVTIGYTSESSIPLAEALLGKIAALPHHPPATSVRADLAQVDAPATILAAAAHAFGTDAIDILVNNAGIEHFSLLTDTTPELFARVFDVNVRGPVLLAAAVAPRLRANGRIVNIASIASRAGFQQLSLYGASKAALEGLTRSWAAELGKNGTTVNCLCPGPVEGEMIARVPAAVIETHKASTPVETRIAVPEEVASIVGWLAGPESSWVSGQSISASGGWQMR